MAVFAKTSIQKVIIRHMVRQCASTVSTSSTVQWMLC